MTGDAGAGDIILERARHMQGGKVVLPQEATSWRGVAIRSRAGRRWRSKT